MVEDGTTAARRGRRVTVARGSNGRAEVAIVPTTQPKANDFVRQVHRHHDAIPGGFAWFCLAAVVGGLVRGVAIFGRPTNRNNDDVQTVEALRVASDGTPNVCSALLAAGANAAKAIGARRVITYTLSAESGASLRGAGWTCTDANTGRSWWASGKSRTPAVDRPHMSESKARWERQFRADRVAYDWPNEAPRAEAVGLFSDEGQP